MFVVQHVKMTLGSASLIALSATFFTLGTMIMSDFLTDPRIVLLPVAEDARMVTISLSNTEAAVSRCGDSQLESISLVTLEVTERADATCSSLASRQRRGELILVLEAARVPVVWQCQRSNATGSGFAGCIRLGVVREGQDDFRKLLAGLAPMPLFIVSSEGMALMPRDS